MSRKTPSLKITSITSFPFFLVVMCSLFGALVIAVQWLCLFRLDQGDALPSLPPPTPARPAPFAFDPEPSGNHGKFYFGAWLDNSAEGGFDTPLAFNQRTGLNASVFQVVETLPVEKPERSRKQIADIQTTQTNALILLTIYTTTLNVTSSHVEDLIALIEQYMTDGRSLFLRINPEFNGVWFVYGQRPLFFLRLWRAIHDAVMQRPAIANRVAFMVWGGKFCSFFLDWVAISLDKNSVPTTSCNAQWCPNPSLGYPYSSSDHEKLKSGSYEFMRLDTNRDGRLDQWDDPYAPYYPGDEYVDWVAMSMYYFGPYYPFEMNAFPVTDVVDRLMKGQHPRQLGVDFYSTYAEGRQKPLFIAETNAAFHLRFKDNDKKIDSGPGELALKQAFWRQYITSPSFWNQYPRIQGFCLFEYEKPEETTIRNFQITKNPGILRAFKEDLAAVESRMVQADPWPSVDL